MIAHNVQVGRTCVIISQTGVSGSTVLEDQVLLAGQTGVAGHLRIGRGAKVGAQTGVMTDVPENAEIVGSPAQPVRLFFRDFAILRKMIREYSGKQRSRPKSLPKQAIKDRT
jgi:UDP-3-O-[3-hydroxymyristoyl] glucosamine N-acyltransferase